MSDTTLNRFLAQGTNAERLAFTPVPPTPASGPDPGYLFYETDTGDMYAWDGVGSAWVQVTSAGAFTNPMTTDQDLIVGGVSGSPGRRGVGSVGQVLTVGSGLIVDWETPVASGGTVTSVSVVSANGFAGSVANATTTPAITLSTNITGILSGNGTAISAASTTGSGAVVLATSATLVTPALGTPTALVLTNATGLPLGSITGFAANVATFLATPSSANLLAALTDKTGTGLNVFGTAPTFASTITVGTAAGTTGAVLLRGTTSGVFTMSVNDAAGTWTAKWPATAGSNTNVLTTDGSGNLSWAAAGGGGAGTVNSGTATQFAYYPASAAAVSGTGTIAVSSTGRLTLTPTVITSGATAAITITAPADTGLTATTQSNGIVYSAATRTWADGTVAAQSEILINSPTYNKTTSAATFTVASTLTVSYPIPGTGVTFTNRLAIWVPAGGIGIGASGTIVRMDADASGAMYLAAAGTNQNLCLAPTGTGVVSIVGSGGTGDLVLSDNASFRTWQGPVGTGILAIQRAAANAAIKILSVNTTATAGFEGDVCTGAYGSLTATDSGAAFNIAIRTYGGTTWFTNGLIQMLTTQTQSETARGAKIILATTPNSSITRTTALTLDQDQTATFGSSIKTSAPSGGTAAFWKLGVLVTAGVTADVTRYLQVDIAGVAYKLIVST